MSTITAILLLNLGFLFGCLATWLIMRPRKRIRRQDIISDDALNAPLELAKNLEILHKTAEKYEWVGMGWDGKVKTKP